jgi:hypothetical protein
MKFLSLFAIFLPLLCSSCAVVTTPVKIVGKAMTTTMEVSGKVIGSGVDAVTPSSDDDENESSE